MPTLFILLQVTFIINETFLSNCQNSDARVLFKHLEEGKKDKGENNNVTVFRELLGEISSSSLPSKRDKDVAKRKLSKQYNPAYQSNNRTQVKQPPTPHVKKHLLRGGAEDWVNTMPASLRNKHFGWEQDKKLNMKKKFRKFLHQLSHCDLGYKWIDLGQSVWPRYIKETYCVTKGCSYPSGMMCQRSEKNMIPVTVLYWTCHKGVRSKTRNKASNGNSSGNKGCEWSRVVIKLISQCICSCDTT